MSRKRSDRGQRPPEPGPSGPAARRYEIVLTRAAEKTLAKLPAVELRRIDARILALAEDPRPPGHEKLTDVEPPLYRVRSGNYRILYAIEDDRLVVTVVTVGNRRDVYRGM